MSFKLSTPQEVSATLGQRLRARRLDADLTQDGLAARSGVPVATLRKFERTGEIAFVSFIRLAMALGDEAALDGLLAGRQRYGSLHDVLEPPRRPQRGRRT
ncbi:helix-turn-helix domain-containing protein [Maricaulis sp.]|uniref:helix-turn-helix domain-containing protein n=1 Tax=Maricaulis sp. TaxID=1486257 RepID=UPI001B156A02|nr:helix-turn-helix transcriptional regulator [Maricaulis sp.]MBO6765075.1 helix-turn-helix transcriptional regulator [Maricaulis sp.]